MLLSVETYVITKLWRASARSPNYQVVRAICIQIHIGQGCSKPAIHLSLK